MWKRFVALAWLVVGAWSIVPPCAAQARFDFRTAPGHLSKDVVPSHYRLALDLDPALDTFRGTVAITLRVRKPAAAIELHARELESDSARIVVAGRARPLSVVPREQSQTWVLTPFRRCGHCGGCAPPRDRLSRCRAPQRRGSVPRRIQKRGQAARMLATQLEPIAARSVFPGFDEPSFRACFAITVTAPSAYEVVSNMPVKSRDVQGGDRCAFRADAADADLSGRGRGRAVRCARGQRRRHSAAHPDRKGQEGTARYAMDVTRKVLPFFREYFGVPYTLPSSTRSRSPASSMARWRTGASSPISKSTLLLRSFEGARSKPSSVVFGVIAHEIAHQWFGNLVTAASWDEIWLNEAFATWMAEQGHGADSTRIGRSRSTACTPPSG